LRELLEPINKQLKEQEQICKQRHFSIQLKSTQHKSPKHESKEPKSKKFDSKREKSPKLESKEPKSKKFDFNVAPSRTFIDDPKKSVHVSLKLEFKDKKAPMPSMFNGFCRCVGKTFTFEGKEVTLPAPTKWHFKGFDEEKKKYNAWFYFDSPEDAQKWKMLRSNDLFKSRPSVMQKSDNGEKKFFTLYIHGKDDK
jgi:hypothetical protein